MLFCAHAIFYFKLIDFKQNSFLVHENVYLIESGDFESAKNKAESIAISNQDMNENGHLELNSKKACYIFAGIRKIIEIESQPKEVSIHNHHGFELTYSIFEVDTLDEVLSLVNGKMVNILYRE